LPHASTLIDAIEDPMCVLSAWRIARRDKKNHTGGVLLPPSPRPSPPRALRAPVIAPRPFRVVKALLLRCATTTNTITTANLTITTGRGDSGITATTMTTAHNAVNTAEYEGEQAAKDECVV